ncbi:hypothetical protein D3C86_956720 [compost metagenome]
MGTDTANLHIQPADCLAASDDTHRQAVVFQDWALFDMGFEVRIEGTLQRKFTTLAYIGQGLSDADTIGITGIQCRLQRQNTSEHRRAEHGRSKARTFLVGPHGDFDGLAGFDALIIQATHHLQSAQHAVDTIEATTFWLGVQVTAHDDRRQGIVLAFAAGEKIANGIERDTQASLTAPAHEQLATGQVFPGKGQATVATALGGANFGHVHQAAPQALTVDLGYFHHSPLVACLNSPGTYRPGCSGGRLAPAAACFRRSGWQCSRGTPPRPCAG